MIAIWPAGPPKLIQPSFHQYRNAAPRVGAAGGACESIRVSVAAASFGRARFISPRKNAPLPRANECALHQAFQQLYFDRLGGGDVTGVAAENDEAVCLRHRRQDARALIARGAYRPRSVRVRSQDSALEL